jgi:hypothetical protein
MVLAPGGRVVEVVVDVVVVAMLVVVDGRVVVVVGGGGSVVVEEVVVDVPLPARYWTTSAGAALGPISHDDATRLPVPSMMITIAFPLTHPPLFTICCRIGLRSAVRCAAPRAPTAGQEGTFAQATGDVRSRDEMFLAFVANAGALSTSCPVIVRLVAPEPVSSTWNWM